MKMSQKCHKNDLFFCYIQINKMLWKYYIFLFYFPILINFGQISPFQIIFWSGKLEENNKIYNWESKPSILNSTIIYQLEK